MKSTIKRILKEVYNNTPDEDVIGKEFWFEYHCWESPESCDAELWYRSHQKVLVLRRGIDDNDEYPEEPKVYDVIFKDGFEGTVYADELMYSPSEFYRPDPSKRKIQESIRRILRESWFTRMFSKPIGSFQDYNSYRYGLDETYEVYEEKNEYVIVNNTSHDSTIVKSLPKSEYSKEQVLNIALGLSEEYRFPNWNREI